MPSTEQIRQYLVTSVVPLITGAIVTWLSSTQVLSILHVSSGSAGQAIAGVLIFGLSAGIAFLSSHHILKGTYSSPTVTLPAPKA